jgi:hypothetical protein
MSHTIRMLYSMYIQLLPYNGKVYYLVYWILQYTVKSWFYEETRQKGKIIRTSTLQCIKRESNPRRVEQVIYLMMATTQVTTTPLMHVLSSEMTVA